MKETAEACLGEVDTNVVVAVPPCFNSPQRQATLNTSTIAGLKILRIPNESIAVAMTYGLDKRNSQCGGETYAMVYHLGGKIFEVFPLEIDHGAINILYTAVDILYPRTTIPDRLDKQTSKPDPPLGWSLRDAGRLARITTSTRNSTSKRYLPAPHDIPRTEVTCEMNPESVLTAEAIEKAPEKIAPLIKEAEGFAAEEEAKKKAEAMNSQESCPESQMDTGGVIKKVLGHQKRNILATSKMFSNAIDESGPKAVPDAPEDKLANMQALSKSIPVEDDENGLFADESIKHDEL
ncbi:ATPase with role in protein import into the ER [Tulasnella sp. 332]|nr:ATPase with role in protein import into the ER [Tulasnella sp. 332]